jgi:hypothetical protein
MAGLLAWLWPIGLGGRMPLGGDVSQFFLGLMGVLGRSLKSGRLPVWNDLWGYGFPGLAESQMGVYYPPNLVLYGLLPTEYAYVASLVLHTLWAGLGGWWAARQFGVSPQGAGLTAIAFAGSGFFVIHLPHPWGYTTGSWLPWALGLGWSILDAPSFRRARTYYLLSVVLVMQVLPGHFQLAFMTQFALLLMAGWSLLETSWGATGGMRTPSLARALALAGCVALAFPLTALQVWPTARLARLAAAHRDFGYLSGFAATPLHLVSLVDPGLFHRSSLWRPLVWDPFHTSPEEMLAYVGLAPLFLALLTIRHGHRNDRRVRLLAVLTAVSLLLALGPYVPGFHLLISVPGFSFFRAPARWTVVASLTLAILAGRGLDVCQGWPRIGRSLLLLAAAAAIWIALVVGLLELALAGGSRGVSGAVTGLFQAAFRARPWAGDPDFRALLAEARKPAVDPRVPVQLLRSRIASTPRDPRSFLQSRIDIYKRELSLTVGLLAGIAGIAVFSWFQRDNRSIPFGLVLLTMVDLWALGRHRPVSLGPLAPLTEQSPILAELARHPRGTRVADAFRNLSMLVNLEPISSYRTLDLPSLEPLTAMARGPLSSERAGQQVRRAMRATGVGIRVLDPIEVALDHGSARSGPGVEKRTTIDDPALAQWLFGEDWLREQGPWGSKFRIIRPEEESSVAWFLPDGAVADPGIQDSWDGALEPLLRLFDGATPLTVHRLESSQVVVTVDAPGEGYVLITQLADPQWRGSWTGAGQAGSLEAEILPTFRRRPGDGGWQRVRVPGPGHWTLRLEYDASDVRQGLAISAAAWLAWTALVVVLEIRSRRRGGSE